MQNAIALIELKSIAKGIEVLDFMLKKAEVTIIEAEPISAGKYYILITGAIAEVEEAYKEGKEKASFYLVDHLFIADIHPTLLPAIEGNDWGPSENTSCAIVETYTISSAIKAANIAAKRTNIKLLKIALGKGIAGKGYFTFTGDLNEIEESANTAKELLERDGALINLSIISNPQPEIFEKLL